MHDIKSEERYVLRVGAFDCDDMLATVLHQDISKDLSTNIFPRTNIFPVAQTIDYSITCCRLQHNPLFWNTQSILFESVFFAHAGLAS